MIGPNDDDNDDDDENDDDDDDDVDAMYDVLDNDIHLSLKTFEWLNGIKKNQCQWFAICGKKKFCFVGQYSKLKSLSRPPFHIDTFFMLFEFNICSIFKICLITILIDLKLKKLIDSYLKFIFY